MAIKDKDEDVKKYKGEFKIVTPIMIDDGKVADAFGVWSHPETFFINRDGRIVGRVLKEMASTERFPFHQQGHLSLVIAFFALILGMISLYDYILFNRGQVAKWKLQLPMGLKKKIHEIIREEARFKSSSFTWFWKKKGLTI